MKHQTITAAQLNGALNSIKPRFPKGAICAIFVFQPTEDDQGNERVSCDFVSNGPTVGLARTLLDWAADALQGRVKVEKHPNGGRET